MDDTRQRDEDRKQVTIIGIHNIGHRLNTKEEEKKVKRSSRKRDGRIYGALGGWFCSYRIIILHSLMIARKNTIVVTQRGLLGIQIHISLLLLTCLEL